MPKSSKKPRPLRIPSYRHHKPSGKAVVTLDGRDFYLGKYKSSASKAEYTRLVAEWTAGRGVVGKRSSDLTVAELLVAFLRHAKQHYLRPDGTETREVANFKLAMKPLRELYGRQLVSDFGPLALKAVRQRMIVLGWSRGVINSSVSRVRHIFKWGTENELVPPGVLHGLQAVAGLRQGRTEARETEPIKPVPEAFVEAVLPHVSPQVAAMIRLQQITGMRSGEVTIIPSHDCESAPSCRAGSWTDGGAMEIEDRHLAITGQSKNSR